MIGRMWSRRVSVSGQFDTLDDAFAFVKAALAVERIAEPTVSIVPLVRAPGRGVRYHATVKGAVAVTAFEVPAPPAVPGS